jgi:hypothetical protein
MACKILNAASVFTHILDPDAQEAHIIAVFASGKQAGGSLLQHLLQLSFAS